MEININNYIDFNMMFEDICKSQKEILLEFREEMDYYDDIINFQYNQAMGRLHGTDCFEIIQDECEITDDHVIFVYGLDFNDANESNPQSTTAECVIQYNRKLERFTSYDYEQG